MPDPRKFGGLRTGNRLRKDLSSAFDAVDDVLDSVPQHVLLPFIGSGLGPTKTTTVILGTNCLAEEFGVGDEIYLVWSKPPTLSLIHDIHLDIHYVPTGTEGGKNVTWETTIMPIGAGGNLGTAPVFTVTSSNQPLPATALVMTELNVVWDPAWIGAAFNFHIRIKRLSSSSNPTSAPAITHLDMDYTANLLP